MAWRSFFRPPPSHWLREHYVDGVDDGSTRDEEGARRSQNQSACCNMQREWSDQAAVIQDRRLLEKDAKIDELKELVKAREYQVQTLEERVSALTADLDLASLSSDRACSLQDKVWVLEEKLASKEAEFLAQSADLVQERAECKALGESLTTLQDIMKRRVSALERELAKTAEQLAAREKVHSLDVGTQSGVVGLNCDQQECERRKEGEDSVASEDLLDGKAEATKAAACQASRRPEESMEAFAQILHIHRSKGDVSSILELMVLHVKNDTFQVEACRTLATLADNEGFVNACKASIQRILASMEKHAGSSAVQAAGCCAIEDILRVHDDARTVTAAAGGISTIIAAVDAHRTTEVLEPAMRALLVLCAEQADLQQLVKDKLGPERATYAISHVSSSLKEQLRIRLLASSI